MPGANLAFDGRDLRAASGDSCGLLVTFLGYLIEGAPVAVENGRRSHVVHVPLANDIGVARIQFHQPGFPAAALAGDHRGARSAEQVHHDVAGLAAVQQRALDQFHRLHRGMQAICRRFIFLPQRALRLISTPRVALPGHVRIEDRLVPEFVAAEAPGESVLRPDDLAADLKAAGLQRVLELALPGRWMAKKRRALLSREMIERTNPGTA
jgi:hypothetical protein